jgi:hypothetical protein
MSCTSSSSCIGARLDLNRVQSNTANPEILGYLNQLTGRAYRLAIAPRMKHRCGRRSNI